MPISSSPKHTSCAKNHGCLSTTASPHARAMLGASLHALAVACTYSSPTPEDSLDQPDTNRIMPATKRMRTRPQDGLCSFMPAQPP